MLCAAAAMWAQSRFVVWFTSVPMAVCLISALCILALIMGLTPQGAAPVGDVAEASARLGFNAMTSSWPFVSVWFVLLLSLGSLVARRLASFRISDWGFYLNHAGLWLVLFAAGLGHADMERYMVRVDEGSVEQMGYDDAAGYPLPLPFAVRLHDFIMEEYPPANPGARAEAKRFVSDVEISTPDGSTYRGLTEVNHPLRVGDWLIYQYGYDREAGPQSRYTVLELVRDPWLVPVYAGFAMIAAGALAMVWKGRRRYGLE
jgi:cytochrome c biogenesis protein ResB